METLTALAHDKDASARRAVAANPNTSDEVVFTLAMDTDTWVRRAVSARGDIPFKVRLSATDGDLFESPAERVFWAAHLEAGRRNLQGLVAQHEVDGYRLDFALPEQRVAIEIDGLDSHSDQASFVKDRARQRELELAGWRVSRFAAREVLDDPRQCIKEADRWVANLA